MSKKQQVYFLNEGSDSEIFIFQSIIKTLIYNYKKDNNHLTFFRLYELMFSYIYDIVFSFTGNESQSVYIVQKTFQSLRYSLNQYKLESDLDSWLREITIEELLGAGFQLSLFPKKSSHAV